MAVSTETYDFYIISLIVAVGKGQQKVQIPVTFLGIFVFVTRTK
jgi:hypothetical protein